MRARFVVSLSVVATMAAGVISVASADASSAVRLGKIQYNSPGTDNRTNTSLNAEWVTITNHSSVRKNLTGWTLRDAQSHIYRFPTFYLRAGYSVRVHTGRGTNTAYSLYWGASNYIWNNTGDRATLKNRYGTTIDTCSWGSTGPGYIYC